MQQTIIKKSITAERLDLEAQFPSGSGFKFSATTAGFAIGYTQAKTPAEEKERRAVLQEFTAPMPGESRVQQMQRIEAFLRGVASTRELVAAIKNRNVKL